MRARFLSSAVVLMSVALAACGGDDSSGPSATDYSGAYTGGLTLTFVSTTPIAETSTGPANGTFRVTLARTSGSSHDISFQQIGGASGATGTVSINSAGIMSFGAGSGAGFEDVILPIIASVCEPANPNTTVGGNVSGSTASVAATTTGLACDWGDGSLRATSVTATFTGQK